MRRTRPQPGRVTPRTDPERDDRSVMTTDIETCPRCQSAMREEYYGPCAQCRTRLRAQYRGEKRIAEAVEYVPKTNVTPNAVALRDD